MKDLADAQSILDAKQAELDAVKVRAGILECQESTDCYNNHERILMVIIPEHRMRLSDCEHLYKLNGVSRCYYRCEAKTWAKSVVL